MSTQNQVTPNSQAIEERVVFTAPTPTPAPMPLAGNPPQNLLFANYLAQAIVHIKNDEESYRETARNPSGLGRMCYGMATTAFGLIELCASIDLAKNGECVDLVKIQKIVPYVSEYLNRRSSNTMGTDKGEKELGDLGKIVKALWTAQRHKIAHTSTVNFGSLTSNPNSEFILTVEGGAYVFHTLPFLRLALHIAYWQLGRLHDASNWRGITFQDWEKKQLEKADAVMPLDLLSDPALREKLRVF